MLLHRKLSVILSVIVIITIACICISTVLVINTYLTINKQQYQEALISNISKDIDTFEQILASVEKDWDDELKVSLPILASRIENVSKRDPQKMQAVLNSFKLEFNLSNVYIISKDLTVVASTLPAEIGLDMSSFSPIYTELLRGLLNQGVVNTHRMSHATNTGILKKYGYYSLPNSDLIMNADITVKERLQDEDNAELSRFLFGDYVENLENKYPIINSIDLVLVSQRDAFSLFYEGRKIEAGLAEQFYSQDPSLLSNESLVIIPIELDSYSALGFKTILKIEFDTSPIQNIQSDLIKQLVMIAILIILLAYLLLQYSIRKFVIKGFINLLQQINNKQVGDDNKIVVDTKDEIAQVASAVNTLMMRFEEQLKENKKLLEISNTDSLTELSNRRHLDQKMAIEWAQAKRVKSTLSIIMIDIDKFKAFNDTYGHEAGDKCLKAVANNIKQQLNRPRDFVARFGGEEFMCLLPNTDQAGAILAANNIREGIYNLRITHDTSSVSDYITASVGCLTINSDHSFSIERLLTEVDVLLYEAKNSGRNKTCYKHIP